MPFDQTPTNERDLSCSLNIIPNKDQQHSVSDGTSVPLHLSTPSNCDSEDKSNPQNDHPPNGQAPITPAPGLHHSHLIQPPTPKNTPENAFPGLGDVSFEEEVYREVPQYRTMAGQACAAEGSPTTEELEKGDVAGIVQRENENGSESIIHPCEHDSADEIRYVGHDAVGFGENREAYSENDSGVQDVNAVDVLEQMITNQSEMYASDSSLHETATPKEQIDDTQTRDVLQDEAHGNTPEFREDENPAGIEGRRLSNTSVAVPPQPVSDGEATYAYSEVPYATNNETSVADTASPLDEEDATCHGCHPMKVHEKQRNVECDVESLSIADTAAPRPSTLQTGVLSDNVSESKNATMLAHETEKADGTMNTIDTSSSPLNSLAVEMFEATSDEAQREDGDNKRLKRSFGENPMKYPRSVLERKPEVEIKKNLFGETSTLLNGDPLVNPSKPQVHPLNIGMAEPSMDPTEPHKSPKTEHYDAHGREAYIEVSKLDQVSPEADVEECLAEPHRASTNDADIGQVPPANIPYTNAEAHSANIVPIVSNGSTHEPSEMLAGEDTHDHSDDRMPAKDEGLPAKDILLDSTDADKTIRQRIKRNKVVSDTVPSEATKSSVDVIESSSFTLRFVTYGMIVLAVLMLLALLFPSRMEQIITGLMERAEGWMTGTKV